MRTPKMLKNQHNKACPEPLAAPQSKNLMIFSTFNPLVDVRPR